MSDGLDTREEHAKVAYQFRGIINELYLTDLKKKTHRGQMGQVLRGVSVGSRGYGMEAAKDHAFTPPPRAWITARIGKLNHLHATRTEKSALALWRLTGSDHPVAAEVRSREALLSGLV